MPGKGIYHMMNPGQMPLTEVQSGESGTIVDIKGGTSMINRLAALGIRPGKRITKISAMLLRGPVTIKVDRSQVAIGHNMANRIIISINQVGK